MPGRWGTPSRQSRVIYSPEAIRRGEGAQMKWCPEPRCSPPVRPVFRGTFGVASGCQVPFQTSGWNVGLHLRLCSRQGPHLVMTRNPRGFSRVAAVFSSFAGNSASFCVGPGKCNLPFKMRGRAGGCAQVTAGQNRPHLGLFPGHNVPLQGRQTSRGCIPDSPGESGLISRGSKGLRSPLESRRVSLGAHRVA